MKSLRTIATCIILYLISTSLFSQELSVEEKKLYDNIMAYRKSLGLPTIPLSKSLTIVAKTHATDLVNNNPVTSSCNSHSWSSNGNWKGCCYTNDHANANCMWNKPRELTKYQGDGFEISYENISGANAENSLNSWKKSPHNAVIINSGIWSDKWNAIGICIYKEYAVVWFGNVADVQ